MSKMITRIIIGSTIIMIGAPMLIAGFTALAEKPRLRMKTVLCTSHDMSVHDSGCITSDGKIYTIEWKRVLVAKAVASH